RASHSLPPRRSSDLGLRNIILSLSAAGWVVYARVVRGEVLSVKQRDYVHAAAALGMGRMRLMFRHVLPNVAPSIIVVASLQFSKSEEHTSELQSPDH